MACGKQHGIAKGILALTLIWVFTGCVHQHPPLQTAPEELPPPVEIKPETPAAVTDTPSKPAPKTAVIANKPSALEIPTSAASEPRFYLHTVRWPEETLSHIAKWYTGTVKNWKAIAKINPELDPKTIDIGDPISIPEDLLTSRKPMPHSFVRPPVRKKDMPLSSSQKTSISSETPKLFGPVTSGPSTIETDAAKLFGPVDIQQSSTEPDAVKLFGPIE